ncbi:MAG: CRISPR-associated helicase Cas3 [Desulfuromonas sp. SDB]|nr:MAG: CRISPR-associated helicase Cas3 [Desulfuromonas sp. SDB]
MPERYYAHSTLNPDKSDWQSLKTHLAGVAELASGFATDFNGEKLAYHAGLLHDLGKYTQEFQKRLEGQKIMVDHSTAGAREASQYCNPLQARILQFIIAGHHTGLLNYGSAASGLERRLNTAKLFDYSGYKKELNIENISDEMLNLKIFDFGFSFSFYIRMLYSCLVDADFLDTESFVNLEKSGLRGKYDSLDKLSLKFYSYMEKIKADSESNYINNHRDGIYNQCRNMADSDPGLFTLTVPTGGGKTLSSMAFALEHLKRNDLKRIFYIIPYTSIIEQNASIFREIFGAENVLEHHSNFDPDKQMTEKSEYSRSLEEKLRLSSENWDIPITVTTNVQFFESLFANKSSRCRKLHNLTHSVIILDEAQMIPTGFLRPSVMALSELVLNYGSSIVICTATQPKLTEILPDYIKSFEIMDFPDTLYNVFKRVRLSDIGEISDSELSERLFEHKQVLCIVNTRKHAVSLYEQLSQKGKCFHLSARMCPVHRRKIIQEIKEKLKKGEICRVISTQLIEAGVDIDFPTVYRVMAGMDSICQAAGRCNREGKRKFGDVFVFRSSEEYGKAIGWLSRTAEIGEMVIGQKDDPMTLDSIEDYFKELYFHSGNEGLDTEKILEMIEENGKSMKYPYEDIGQKFRLIKDSTKDIVIPCDDKSKAIIERIRRTGFIGNAFRELQGYVVNVYQDEFEIYEKLGLLECVGERFHLLLDIGSNYSNKTGLLNRKINGRDSLLLIH